MATEKSPKLKIVYLMKILLERTDETHAITMKEILSALKEYGIEAERKSIYSDIDHLKEYGLDIIGEQREKTFYYYIGNRQFELAELKLLVDSVQSARFITEKKSNELIKKIEGMASRYEANELQHQVFVAERVKTENKEILYNIDSIHKAIVENSKISFKYFNWNVKKEMELRHDGEVYTMSPWAMTLSDENYYLVCYDEKTDAIKYFRVDKMVSINLLNKPREGEKNFRRFDIAAYSKLRFHMYDGDVMSVKLLCHNSYAGVIIDRFGRDISIRPADEEHFYVTVNVAVSDQFIAWVFSMHKGLKIVGPESLVERSKQYATELAEQYKE